MRHDYISVIKLAFILAALLLLAPESLEAANAIDELRNYLRTRASFDVNDISRMEGGEYVSKLLPVNDKHEIAFCGVISLNAMPEKGFDIFKERLSRLDKKALMASGSFSDVPTISDLQTLTLERVDIESLKNCRVGACDLNLSTDMIRRFQSEVDWTRLDHSEQATDLFRRLILEYVTDYQSRGHSAWIEYANYPHALSLGKENDQLLKELRWIDAFAPEFSQYLQGPSSPAPTNIRRWVTWAKLKFGLKPVIMLTEMITYSPGDRSPGTDLLLSISRQIYASHYVDSSMGLIAVIQNSESETTSSSYLLYVNHSRSSVLRGIFGNFIRKLVEHEVMESVKLLLENSKYFADYESTKQNSPPIPATAWQKTVYRMKEHPYIVGLVILIGVGLVIHWIGRRAMK